MTQLEIHQQLPALPEFVFEINRLLREKPVDLKRVSAVIAADASLAGRVVRMCNATQKERSGPVSSMEEAVILAGAGRMRALLLICALLEYAGQQIPFREIQFFLRHSLLTAILSEQMARCFGYPEAEKAYLAGLLHDVGVLPLLGEGGRPGNRWECCYGVNHCEMGCAIGILGNFGPEITEVLERHHHPKSARTAPGLVELVAAADQFAEEKGIGLAPPRALLMTSPNFPALKMEEIPRLARILEEEFALYTESR